jgi:hypothetical protein
MMMTIDQIALEITPLGDKKWKLTLKDLDMRHLKFHIFSVTLPLT